MEVPETLEPTEMFEVSPSREAGEVWQYLQEQLATVAAAGDLVRSDRVAGGEWG